MEKIDSDALAKTVPGGAPEQNRSGARVRIEHQLLERRVDELVWEQADRTPDEIAVVCDDESATYAQLIHRAERLAQRLLTRGIGAGALVGIHLERSLEMLVAMLAVLRAGAAYVPLDPDFPSERLRHMVQDSRPGVVIGHSQRPDSAALGAPLLAIDAPQADPGDGPEDGPRGTSRLAGTSVAPRAADALAYVLYTSGSTGKPKGVAVEHRNLVNLLLSMKQEPGLEADDVLLAITTLSFDIAALELLLPLLAGAKVVIAAAGDSADGERLQELLRRHRVTVMQATPTVWRLLVDSGWSGGGGFKALCGGEALPVDLAQALAQRCELWNMYGPTETTVWSSCYRVPPSGRPVLVGRPIANTRIYILDKARQPLPIGVPGEIYIAGAGVARGYLGRPELTAERFLDDPLQPGAGERMYRTGDLGRYLPDGNFECRGRIDSQVKVRGFRIELGEIEAALCSCPGVAAAVVNAVARSPGDVRLVAYVRSTDVAASGEGGEGGDGTVTSPHRLREQLAALLPAYMIPQHFMAVASFALLPNGKLDRASLPPPPWDATSTPAGAPGGSLSDGTASPPRTEAEKALASIWCSVLGVEQVDADANFFDLGGHSLLVTVAVAEARAAFGVRLHPARFAVETLAQLAASLEAAALSSTSAEEALAPAPPLRDAPARLSHAPLAQPPASDGLLARLRRRLAGAA